MRHRDLVLLYAQAEGECSPTNRTFACSNQQALERVRPDGRHTGIAKNKHPSGIDRFIEVNVIHSGCVQYGQPDVRDNHKGATAVQYYQGQITPQYIAQMKRKDNVHFGLDPKERGPF